MKEGEGSTMGGITLEKTGQSATMKGYCLMNRCNSHTSLWWWKIMNSLGFVWRGVTPLLLGVIIIEVELCLPKQALVLYDGNVKLNKVVKHKQDLFRTLFLGGTGNKVIEIFPYKLQKTYTYLESNEATS